MFGKKPTSPDPQLENSFTCSSMLMVIVLAAMELLHNIYQSDIDQLLMKWTHADHVPSYISMIVTFVILVLIGLLFDRQQDVVIEDEYIQIGNSPLHFYRTDEIREIKLKEGRLTIYTRRLRFLTSYHVRKPQRTAAHRLLCEWANQHGIVYKIM
ncbi:hypothetical protein [Tumebacillus flagellatus]|uniref:Uncharacterized protein n=1 Tax=Tumebacillus flagellatus TaxID=1157490 RepID=A0A074MCQ6_9BACL|nr:hypothetical protein [Tumebacillus flagellatus]KEO83647.1 hypothetical protein EL26_08280 [Tumebacillus flagellatus]